jgi:hypothetical protein
MGSLTDRLNSVQRRTIWRMSHEAAIKPNHINTKEDMAQANGCKDNKVKGGFFFNGRMSTKVS